MVTWLWKNCSEQGHWRDRKITGINYIHPPSSVVFRWQQSKIIQTEKWKKWYWEYIIFEVYFLSIWKLNMTKYLEYQSWAWRHNSSWCILADVVVNSRFLYLALQSWMIISLAPMEGKLAWVFMTKSLSDGRLCYCFTVRQALVYPFKFIFCLICLFHLKLNCLILVKYPYSKSNT